MEFETAELAYRAIEQIEAQESLVSLRVAQAPHISQKDRDKLHRHLYKTAFPENEEAKIKLTFDEAMARING
jgi:hypothetical protein